MTDLPDGWVPALLEHVCDVINGITPDPKDQRFWGGEMPFVTPTDLGRMSSTDIYISRATRALWPAGWRIGKTKVVPAGTLLISTKASIGHMAVAGVELAVATGVTALVPNDRIADPVYLYGYLRRNLDEIRKLTNRGYIAGVRKSDLARFPVAVAPADEQRRIGEMLRKQFAAVTDAKRRAATRIEQVDALKASLLRAAMGGQAKPPTDLPEPVVFGVQQRMRI